MKRLFALFVASVLGFASNGHAATISLSSTDNGWFEHTGRHVYGNHSIILRDYINLTNTYFRFDITGLGPIDSAIFTIHPANGFYWGGEEEIIGVKEVLAGSRAFDTSYEVGSLAGEAIYNDLGEGLTFGTVSLTGRGGMTMPEAETSLNLFGISAFNQAVADGESAFILGVTLLTGAGNEALWSSSGGVGAATLTVTTPTIPPVPVPPAGFLVLMGFGSFALLRRRGTKK